MLQFPGGPGLADTLGVNVNNPCAGAEYLALRAEGLADQGFCLVHAVQLLRCAFKQGGYGIVLKTSVEGEFQKGTQILTRLCEFAGAVLATAESLPAGVRGAGIVGVQPLHLHIQVGQQLSRGVHGLPQVQRDFVAEFKPVCAGVISCGAIVKQQRRVHGHNVHEGLRHGHTTPGVDSERPAIFNKIPDGLQIPLRDGRIRRGEGAVIVNSQ